MTQIRDFFKDNSSNTNWEKDLKYHHENRDPEENKETTPPEDEKVFIPTIWAMEAYPPSYFSNLESRIHQLGWIDSDKYSNSDFLKKLSQYRLRSSGWASVGIGYVYPHTDKNKVYPRPRKAKLPSGIDWVYLNAFQYLPSTTIISFQFKLKDKISSSVEESLRKKYKTYFKETETGYSIHSVSNQKQKNTKLTREYLRSICRKWVKETLPGYFSSKISVNKIPTSEVLILEKAQPFSEVKGFPSYENILDINNKFWAWESEEMPEFYMYLDANKVSNADCLVFTANKTKLWMRLTFQIMVVEMKLKH
ncbi:hypothetical protein ACG2F4_01785 [Halalkalibaculum sp. DA3122]|uniref:hypothetical protein n=1 Tax=Halalkalibaculum sp. DA3122 TaxID=3373607 RepID=UPI003754E7F3